MSDDDHWQKRENDIFREELDKLKKIEEERALLKDKSIGGPHALRPTDEFIDQSLGKPLNSMEQAQKAGERTEMRIAQEQEAAEQKRQEQKQARSQMDENARARKEARLKRKEQEQKQTRGRTR